ncbi:putative FAD-linked oxidoreductase [bacterium BMS3Abin02]|nr:putative FAD-linked oxidoreductase [bacterium BMS3Abin02]
MTSIAAVRKRLGSLVVAPVPGAPAGALSVAPASEQEAARIMEVASEYRLPVLVLGGGTHQGYGAPVDPVIVVSTHNLQTLEWRPDDLTATVGAGVGVADLEQRLVEGGQTAVLPEDPGEATVGGVVAAGISGYRRLRYGPTRDRVLGMTLVTGDGRIVRAGGTVVKNVSGYDLSRLAVGSFGRLGIITAVSLKLWPRPQSIATVVGVLPEKALEATYRPLAVLEVDGQGSVVVGGHPAMVEAEVDVLGGESLPGAVWPAPLQSPFRCALRVPARLVRQAVEHVPPGWSYRAAFGVGEVRMGAEDPDVAALSKIREWAESVGGRLVVEAASDDLAFDPWGTAPSTVGIQRRLVAAFDPAGIVNPGRLPGGI